MNEELKKWLHQGTINAVKARYIKFINLVVETYQPEKLQYTCSKNDNSSLWNYYNDKLNQYIYIGSFDGWTTYVHYEKGILFQFIMNDDTSLYKQRIPIDTAELLGVMEQIDDEE